VVLESGSCIALDDTKLKGLFEAWYPGEEGGTAVAEILFGKTNPSGRLPITFYRSLDQVPPFRDYKMAGRTYRYFTGKPQYPFGYGLSYTRFKFGDISIKHGGAVSRLSIFDWSPNPTYFSQLFISVRATVKNAGLKSGNETVQVYASRVGGKWPEPAHKLVAFRRVSLGAGESQSISIDVSRDSIAQADANGNLKVVPGEYVFTIGGGQPGREPATSGKAYTIHVRL
jgi:beta-glucosidase